MYGNSQNHKENLALGKSLSPDLPDIKAHIVYAVSNESTLTLVDILRRRTTLAMNGDYGLGLLPVFTETLEQYCGWDLEKSDYTHSSASPSGTLKDSLRNRIALGDLACPN